MCNPKSSNKFMMFFLLYNPVAVVILMVANIILSAKGWDENGIMQFSLIAQDFVLFIVPMAFYLIITGKTLGEVVPMKKLSFKNAIYVIIITYLAMPTIMVISSVTSLFVSAEVSNSFKDIMLELPWWVSVISIAVLPSVCEEFMFRGYILTGYKKAGFLKAALVSALFFGMMHLDLYQLPYATFAGVLFASFVFYTGSIYSSVLAHFIINGSQTISFLIATNLLPKEEVEAILSETATMENMISSLYSSIISMVISLPFLIYFIRRFVKRNRAVYIEYCTGGYVTEGLSLESTRPKEKCFDKFFVLSIVFFIINLIIFK